MDPRIRSERDWRRPPRGRGTRCSTEAVASEHRLAGVVTDPGCYDYFASWPFPPVFRRLLEQGERRLVNEYWEDFLKGASPVERFEIAKRTEIFPPSDAYDLLKTMQEYEYRSDIPRISSPALVFSPQREQFYPGQAAVVYELLTAAKKLVRFTVAEGAQFHCEPMARQFRNETLYAWLVGAFAGDA